VEKWPMIQVRSAHKTKNRFGQDSKSVFAVKKFNIGLDNNVFYYFQVRGSQDMEDASVLTIGERLNNAVDAHKSTNIMTHSYQSLCADPTIACDDLPRQFMFSIAWILANDMKVPNPFDKGKKPDTLKDARVMADNGYLPLYTSYSPEILLREWLNLIDGATIPFRESDWVVKNPANMRYEYADKLNTMLTPAQLKLFAVMVALAHCACRHKECTQYKDFDTAAREMASCVFYSPPCDAQQKVFARILEFTKTSNEFREMFHTVFHDARPPVDVTKQPQPVVRTPSVQQTKPSPSSSSSGGVASLCRASQRLFSAAVTRVPQPVVFIDLPGTTIDFLTAGDEKDVPEKKDGKDATDEKKKDDLDDDLDDDFDDDDDGFWSDLESSRILG